jgi:hypothetical protein
MKKQRMQMSKKRMDLKQKTAQMNVDFESDLNITGKLSSTLLRNCEDQAMWKDRLEHLAHSVPNFAQLKVTTNLIDRLNFAFHGKKGIPHRGKTFRRIVVNSEPLNELNG